MKQFCFFLLLIFPVLLTAQKQSSLTDFGKVDKAALLMKECSFDKGAGAMVLFDEAESLFNLNIYSSSPVFQQTEHHTRIKIFNKKGFDQANVKIRYGNDNNVSIKNLSAQTYNMDEAGNIVITKVDKSSIYDKQINKRYSERIFFFPDVKEGSILEYSYTLDGVSEGKWYFQKSIPVQSSKHIIVGQQSCGDLVSFNKNDLMKFRNFGKKSLTELDELVANKNLTFGMDLGKYKLDKE